jgi:hypothetical protein
MRGDADDARGDLFGDHVDRFVLSLSYGRCCQAEGKAQEG